MNADKRAGATLKRILDILLSTAGLLVAAPLLVVVGVAIYLCDFHNPLYVAPRVGRNFRPFRMVKFRSMIVDADRRGGSSTSSADARVTPIGRFVRRFKLDELVQLWNVLWGDMSLVGPRPNVPTGVAIYTAAERRLLSIRPGITDFASIVFADEGEILKGHPDADLAYDRLIRPWKSRLGLLYIDTRTVWLDVQLIALTFVALFSRETALARVCELVRLRGASEELAQVARRVVPLRPVLPPGANVSAGRPQHP